MQPTLQQTFDLALHHHKAGRLHDAELLYRKVLGREPRHPDALHFLGVIAHQMGQNDLAADLIRRAVAIKPLYPQAYANLGAALADSGQFDPAIAAFRQAIAMDPTDFHSHDNLILALTYHPADDPQAIAAEIRRWNQQHAQPLAKFIQPHRNDRNPDRRLRIGYISPDFCAHVVGNNLLPVFRNHDHGQFEIFSYAQVPRPDATTAQFQQMSDGWRNIVGITDDQLANQIRDDQVDILVDLSLHSLGNRLLVFARKPAPVQATFAAYPGSTGLTAIDYRLSDPYLDEPGMDESVYSEQTLRLPDSFWCYDPPDSRDLPVNALPAMETGAITFGCLNNFSKKINDAVLTLWSQVLRQTPGSRLLLLASPGPHRQRTIDRFSQLGIDPPRIEFVPRQSHRDYLKLYHRIDLGLDSFPYNGHTTSLDSFWMGVPVVTLIGRTIVSRAGLSQLSNLGLPELAAKTPDQFVRLAVELAGDLPRLKEMRSTLRHRMEQSPLMDAPKFAKSIETACRKMWHTWCQKVSAVS